MMLPPLLSPTLPIEFSQLPEPLSPTLPPQYNEQMVVKLKYGSGVKRASTRSYSSSEDESEVKVREEPRVKVKEAKGVKKEEPVKGIKQVKESREIKEIESKPKPRESKSKDPNSKPKESKPKDPNPKPKESKPKDPNLKPKEDPKPDKPASRQPSQEPTYELGRYDYWTRRARSIKHEADEFQALRQHQEAVVRVVDSIVCFIRGFIWEDLSREAVDKVHLARSWETMLPYLQQQISYLESVDAEIAGVCYLIRAVCCIHIAKSLKHYRVTLTPMKVKPSTILYEAISNFSSGLMYLPHDIVVHKYGINWKANVRAERLAIKRDTCVLPLHTNSSIRDAATFGYRIVAEWARHENLGYEFACAQDD